MNPEKNIDEILDRYMTSARQEDVESHCEQVFERLQTRAENHTANPRSVRSVRRWQWSAIAVAAALITVAVLLPTRILQSAPAILEDGNGMRKIHYGEIVRSSDDMNAVLAMVGGARIEMRSMSELSLERAGDGVRIHLTNGGVIVDAAGQNNGNLYVETKDMTASVGGAVSFVKAEEQGSRIAAIGGEVRVQQGEKENTLRAGEQVASNPKMESIPVKEAVSWSREAASHAAMLQQSTASPPAPRDSFDVVSIRKSVGASRGGGGPRGAAGQQEAGPSDGGGPCSGRLQKLDPSRFAVTNAGVYFLIAFAYGFDDGAFPCGVANKAGFLSGGPDWIRSEHFDIEAGIPEGPSVLIAEPSLRRGTPVPITARRPGPRLRNMVKAMLEERFKLKLRRDMKDMTLSVLSVAGGGAKLAPYKDGEWVGSYLGVAGYPGLANGIARPKPYEGMLVGGISGGRATTAQLALQLSQMTGRPVQDRTNLPGYFTYEFFFAPADYGKNTGHDLNKPDDPRPKLTSPSLFKVLEDELGLKLTEQGREKVDVFVVESIEKPSEN